MLSKLIQSMRNMIEKFMVQCTISYTRKKWRKIFRGRTKATLTAEQSQACEKLYGRYFKLDPIFHAFYTEKTGVFDPRYLPDDYYFGNIDRYYNDHTAGGVLDNKCFYARMFGDICRQPKIFAYRMNGFWYTENMEPIGEEELFGSANQAAELVVKAATNSFGGYGVRFINGANGNIEDDFREAVSHIRGDIVVQYPIRQHSAIAKLHPESVNTIRCFSFLREDEVKIYSTVVRMGAGSARVDNASGGGITCGVLEDGRLKEKAFTTQGDMFLCHPTTNVAFSDVTIPYIEEIKETVKKLHRQIPHFRIASWDMSVDEEGHPILIETNLRAGGICFHQLNNGPVFGDDTAAILEEVFGHHS